MIISADILLIFAAILIVCSIGFKKYVWFISIGYGLSITTVGAMLLVLFSHQLDYGKLSACIVLICYGLRLGGYLAFREIKSKAYNRKMKKEISDGKNMPPVAKISLWVTCALLYILMTSPIIFRFVNDNSSDLVFAIGLIISVIGIAIESASDLQKSMLKKKHPNKICRTGLFKIVRCPNYLGELIIWTGVFVSGLTTLTGIGQWTLAIIGYLGIVYIMFSGARRLELRQDRVYEDDKDYKEYVKTTPILIPLIPLYSVKKYKWLVG